jgi:S-formylglutathione hydrolase FrmB
MTTSPDDVPDRGTATAPGVSRRRVLTLGAAGAVVVGAGGLAGVESGRLPGKVSLDRRLGLSHVEGRVPSGGAGPVRYDTFDSVRRATSVTWGLALPPGTGSPRDLPMALVLHGRGDDARSALDHLALPAFLADHVRKGGRPLALVSVDGGTRYWHPRRDGDDPLGMVLHELLPRAKDAGLRTGRIAVLGYSMGGYGALMMARESEAGRLGDLQVAAAAASSPALFASAGASAPGAFDDPADWQRWGDLAAHPGVRSTPLTVSCGTSDPFAGTTRAYRSHLPHPAAGGLSRGAHDTGYWRSLLPAQLIFLARHL